MEHALEVYNAVAAVVDPVYLVGGSVRDVLMGRECSDYDFTTPLVPDRIEAAVREAGRRPYLIGKKYGTVGFKADGRLVEVTTFRSEVYPDDTRRPEVVFLDDLAADLARRDFTINAIAMQGEQIIDLFGGQADIEARVIRAVGNPRERFKEDPLRMLRAARFASQLGFSVEPATTLAMERYAHRILHVARERWMAELDKLLVGPSVVYGLELLAATGLLRFMLPELELQVGYDQNSPYHDRTLFEHTVGRGRRDRARRHAALGRAAPRRRQALRPRREARPQHVREARPARRGAGRAHGAVPEVVQGAPRSRARARARSPARDEPAARRPT